MKWVYFLKLSYSLSIFVWKIPLGLEVLLSGFGFKASLFSLLDPVLSWELFSRLNSFLLKSPLTLLYHRGINPVCLLSSWCDFSKDNSTFGKVQISQAGFSIFPF